MVIRLILPGLSRYLLLVALSVLLMVVDLRVHLLSGVGHTVAAPFHLLSSAPAALGQWFAEVFVDKIDLQRRYRLLRREYEALKVDAHHHAAIDDENRRLKELLSIPQLPHRGFQVAELIDISFKPFQRAVLGKGRLAGVHRGQLVVDSRGVYGQVSDIGLHTSSVLLLTSVSHSIPVGVKRNGLHAVVYGLGSLRSLRVAHLAPLADVVVGDLLLTSGLGHRFPSGYPVARVTEVVREAGDGSLHISAEPLARFGYNKEVLLVRPWRQDDEARDATTAANP